MIKVLALFFILSVSIASSAKDMTGSYFGTGANFSDMKDAKVVFHLREIPINTQESILVASFRRARRCDGLNFMQAIYFNQVEIENFNLVMTTEIAPRREFGTIVNSLSVNMKKDGSLIGHYFTNSMASSGKIIEGSWTATKFDPETFEHKLPADCPK